MAGLLPGKRVEHSLGSVTASSGVRSSRAADPPCSIGDDQ